jgi:hypothetical protein
MTLDEAHLILNIKRGTEMEGVLRVRYSRAIVSVWVEEDFLRDLLSLEL